MAGFFVPEMFGYNRILLFSPHQKARNPQGIPGLYQGITGFQKIYKRTSCWVALRPFCSTRRAYTPWGRWLKSRANDASMPS